MFIYFEINFEYVGIDYTFFQKIKIYQNYLVNSFHNVIKNDWNI